MAFKMRHFLFSLHISWLPQIHYHRFLATFLWFSIFSMDRVLTEFSVFQYFFHVIQCDVSVSNLGGHVYKLSDGHHRLTCFLPPIQTFFVICVIYFWCPWQFPYASPYTVIFFLIICTALVIWAAIIVNTSVAVRYLYDIINVFRGVFSNWTFFYSVGTWVGYCPVTLNVIPPGKVLATIWTLNHFWCVPSSIQKPTELTVLLEGLYRSRSSCYSE